MYYWLEKKRNILKYYLDLNNKLYEWFFLLLVVYLNKCFGVKFDNYLFWREKKILFKYDCKYMYLWRNVKKNVSFWKKEKS